jgi:hypothetical protein
MNAENIIGKFLRLLNSPGSFEAFSRCFRTSQEASKLFQDGLELLRKFQGFSRWFRTSQEASSPFQDALKFLGKL